MVLERLEPLRINTLVICANMFSAEDQRSRKHMKRLITQLNRKHVYRVGNHRWPATDSMTKYGLNPDKAIAWDWPGARHPQDFPVKTLDTSRPAKVFYVGTLSKAKGVCEVLEAIRILRSKGCQAQLQIAGDGPERQWLLDRATAIEGIELLGQVSNDEVFDTMRESTLVCVPSRHEFSEGMPLSLTEALASRTPVVASDHPVLRSSLRDGEGAVIFRAGEAVSLAEAIGRVLTDASFYASLSASTLHAYQRLQCPTSFGDLVEDWQRSWRRDLQAQC
jgi:glycosyltransferase involved in cell wall biosynthesis